MNDIVPQPSPTEDGGNDRLFEELYRELHRIAQRTLKGESPSFSIGPTALVNETWLRLQAVEGQWNDKGHFLRCAASTMRRCIIDHVRARKAVKRPQSKKRKQIDGFADVLEKRVPDLLSLNDSLEKLSTLDPRLTQVVELRFFSGHSTAQVGEIMGVSERQAMRWWSLAKAWLHKELTQ